jgi:FecR protein
MVETRRATAEQTLASGDVVRTADDPSTVAEVVHRNGAVTRLDRRSEVTVDRIESNGRPRIVVSLGPGRTWHHTGPLDDPTLYEVRCPGAVLTARCARFALFCRDDGATSVLAVEGNVVVRGTVSGSVALGDGQSAEVDAAGVVTGVGTGEIDDRWVALNVGLDTPAFSTGPVPVEKETARPAWVGRAGVGLAAALFMAIVGYTFVTADQANTGDRRAGPISAGAGAAMIRATQDRNVAPEVEPTTTALAAVPVAPVVAPAPSAHAVATSCRQTGRTIVYSGTVTNVGQAASPFVVDAYFVHRGARFDAGTTTVGVLSPGASTRWEVRVAAPGDLRNSGASCELAGVRPLASPSAIQ